MPKHRLEYYCTLLIREYIQAAPGIGLSAAVRAFCPFRLISGIRVIDPTPETRSHFTEVVDAALATIARFDPIRFARVQREIRIIVNAAGVYGSTYGRALKFCSLDLRCFYDEDDPNTTVRLLASALVYEATFGHLFSRGILRTRQNGSRFDALCCREPQRFLRRLGMANTPWDPDQLSTIPRHLFWKQAMTQLRGLVVRDAAAEAKVWEETNKRLKE